MVIRDLEVLSGDEIPGLIQESLSSQVSHILTGDYNLKLARQDYFISNQDQVSQTSSCIQGNILCPFCPHCQQANLRQGKLLEHNAILGELRYHCIQYFTFRLEYVCIVCTVLWQYTTVYVYWIDHFYYSVYVLKWLFLQWFLFYHRCVWKIKLFFIFQYIFDDEELNQWWLNVFILLTLLISVILFR